MNDANNFCVYSAQSWCSFVSEFWALKLLFTRSMLFESGRVIATSRLQVGIVPHLY
jgi:hypothetical protein